MLEKYDEVCAINISQLITHTHKEKESTTRKIALYSTKVTYRHELIRRSNTHLRSIKELKMHCKV